uniref:Uncharacterized protein n=1 Tax=Dictyoglomus turgidum TaxID=513050 RepID=A0A7C3WLG0_9BACT
MSKGHSIEKRETKKTVRKSEKKVKTISDKKRKSLLTLLTEPSLEKKFDEINIQQVNTEELFDIEDLNTPSEEDIEGVSITEEYGEIEDEDIDFDEPPVFDPFDVEDRESFRNTKYIAEVSIRDGKSDVQFLYLPIFDAKNNLINGMLIKRNRIFKEMAYFIAERQKEFFISFDFNKVEPLNQKDLVKYINGRGYKLEKSHISRLLSSLFFRVKGKGDISARQLFKRYGYKTGLSKDEMLKLAEEFTKKGGDYKNQLDKAIKFHEYLKGKGIKIQLSNSTNNNDKYRHLKNILKEVENAYGKTQG